MNRPLIIAGGGLAGGLAALALAERQPDRNILLLEAGDSFGGNHTWSWFDSDLRPEHRWLSATLKAHRWNGHQVRFPRRSRQLSGGYNSLTSEDFDQLVRSRVQSDRYRLGTAVAELGPEHVRLESGERIEGCAVIDARGFGTLDTSDLAWQKFLGIVCRFERPHGLDQPIVMDALVDQSFGYRFVYALPFSPTELLLEDTYYCTQPGVDAPRLRRQIGDYAQAHDWGPFEVVGEEVGVLPIPLGGAFEQWWPKVDAVARLGVRGGFFHPTTGYSLPDAIANAALLAEQTDFSPELLHQVFRQRAERLWRERGFYRLLNRMLFAAGPGQRYRVLEHFYRLPEPLVARLYAARTSGFDKLRILSGRPPVPIGPAIAAARRRA